MPSLSPKSLLLRSLLLLLFLLAFARWAGLCHRFGQRSLQMDFSAFYTAGEAMNQGLSPYENHIAREPPVWDGYCEFQHSRFLYPPLAAAVFRPLAALPYAQAKRVWMLLMAASVVLSVVLQIIVPNKYLGMLIMVVYILALLSLPNAGWEDPLYLYGATSSTPYSDMNGYDGLLGKNGAVTRAFGLFEGGENDIAELSAPPERVIERAKIMKEIKSKAIGGDMF